jgi:hypothetical protein
MYHVILGTIEVQHIMVQVNAKNLQLRKFVRHMTCTTVQVKQIRGKRLKNARRTRMRSGKPLK